MPAIASMVSRGSSITNAFVNTLIPQIEPTTEEIETALSILGINPEEPQCAYCGDGMTEWDHLRPLVENKRPTGYISEIANLVPACGKCNQSKGNKPWRTWILSTSAKRSPTARGKVDVAERTARLEAFELWREPTKINIEAIIGKDQWDEYWRLLEKTTTDLRRCQEVADVLSKKIMESLRPK
jgi:hypothetical protein